jgi:hypothetical protein
VLAKRLSPNLNRVRSPIKPTRKSSGGPQASTPTRPSMWGTTPWR